MLGRMQEWPLLMHKIIDYAAIQHPAREVASRTVEGPMNRTNYREIRDRALKVAKRLDRDGIRLGDRVATLAWNGFRHLEAWYGIAGIGAVYHTVNPRLFPDQIAWIINHAEDRVMMTDLTFAPLLEKLADKLPRIVRYIVFTDAAHMPATTLRNAVPYEEWIGDVDGDFTWKTFDENTAAGMCYTSGTTGDPKGVLYSHRSNILHALMANNSDMKGLSSRDVVLPVVPMFHANTWAINFTPPISGASLVLPGPKLDGASIYELLDRYKVSCSAGGPTVWGGTARHSAASRCAVRPSPAPITKRTATSSIRRDSSTPAMSRPSTATVTCTSPIAPRTSSSQAGSGFHPSISSASPSVIPRWRRPP